MNKPKLDYIFNPGSIAIAGVSHDMTQHNPGRSYMEGLIDFGFKGGADTFIHKGTNGRWVGVLDEEDLALYDEAMSKLPPDYAMWLQNGRLTAGNSLTAGVS